MTNNISRFLQLDSTILMEYIINNSNITSDSVNSKVYDINVFNPAIYEIRTGNNKTEKLYIQEKDIYKTNNFINHIAVPIDSVDGKWFIPINGNNLKDYCVTNKDIKNLSLNVPFDTIKFHIINGYTFKDIYGILIQVKVKNNNNEYSRLTNWLYRRSDIGYIYERPLILENKIYDKYIELQIPSYKYLSCISNVSGNNLELIGKDGLNINEMQSINNIEIVYSIILNDSVENVYSDSFNKNLVGHSFLLNNQLNQNKDLNFHN